MKPSPLVTVPVVAVAPLVGAAAIAVPGLFGGPIVVLVAGYVLVFVFSALPHRANAFAAVWWLLAFVTLVPPMLPVVVVPAWGTLQVPAFPGPVAWWVGAGLAVAWWVVWLRVPVVDAFRTCDVGDDRDPDPEPALDRSRARDLTLNHTPAPDVPIVSDPVRNLGPDRYAGLVIRDESEDVEDESMGDGIVAEALAVWPANRAREDGKVPLTDLAELVGMDARDLAAELAGVGVECPRENVRPVVRSGNPSRQKAVSWSALRAAGCATARATP